MRGMPLNWTTKLATWAAMLLLGTSLCSALVKTTTTMQVSNGSPSWKDTVTLTSTTVGGGGGSPNIGTVTFYEVAGDGFPDIALQTVNIASGQAVWTQKFMGGTHQVYAMYNGTSYYAASTSADSSMTVSSPLRVPSSGTYLGIWATTTTSQEAGIESLESTIGNGIDNSSFFFAFHTEYKPWTVISDEYDAGSGTWFPDSDLAGDMTHGRVPVISWGCDGANWDSDQDVSSGTDDTVINNTANALAQYPGPVLLRWSWEFNDYSSHEICHGDHPGSGNPYTAAAKDHFIAAWQHIYALFQADGATNVEFLWNPGDYDTSSLSYKEPYGFYPGDTFVDWIGLDSYQSLSPSVTTFQDDVGPFYSDYSSTTYNDEGKPLMIGENGSINKSTNGTEYQPTYLSALLSDFTNGDYPQLKAYDYFDGPGGSGSQKSVQFDPAGLAEYEVIAGTSVTTMFQASVGQPVTASLSSSSGSVSPGNNLQLTVTVAPTGSYSGNVNLSASGLPSGVTASFNPATITGSSGTSILTISTTSAVTPGTYTVIVTARAASAGGNPGSASYALTVKGGTFSLAESAATGSESAPGSAQTTLTISPASGYSGTVNLTATELGNGSCGVSASFSKTKITGGSGTSTLTLSSTASTLNATYHVRVTATDSNNPHLVQYTYYILTVTGGSATCP